MVFFISPTFKIDSLMFALYLFQKLKKAEMNEIFTMKILRKQPDFPKCIFQQHTFEQHVRNETTKTRTLI